VLETNVHGLLRMTRLCLQHIRDGGHIVNMGSIAGRQPYENAAVYIASKYAVRGFTYALREDLLGRPIHLTTVDPGLVESNFSRPLPRRRGEGGSCLREHQADHARRRRRVRDLRGHAPASREHRRARGEGAGPVDPRENRARQLVPLPAMTARLPPAITLRQSPRSPLRRPPACTADDRGLWLGASDRQIDSHHRKRH